MQVALDKLIVPALAGVWFAILIVGLFLLEWPLEWITYGTLGLAGLMGISSLKTRWVVFALILLAMFLNVANYSFLTFDAQGDLVQSQESSMIAVLRLPIVFLALVVVFQRYGAGFASYLRQNWDVLVFCLMPFFSIPFAFDAGHAAQYALWMLLTLVCILALMYVLRVEVPSWQWAEYIGWLLFGSSAIMVVFAMTALPDTLSGANTGAVRASYGSAYIYSLYCSVVLAALLVLERQKSYGFATRFLHRIPIPLVLVMSLMTVVPLVFSGKRSAILTAGLVLLVYFFAGGMKGSPRRASGLVRSLVVVGILAGAVWVFLPKAEFTLARFGKTLDSEQNASVTKRFEVFESGMEVFKEYPVFGVGLDNGRTAVGFGLHNTYLGILVETGAIGVLFFLLIAFRSLRSWHRMHPYIRVAVVMVAIPPVLISATEFSVTPGQAMFWPLWISLLMPRLYANPPSAPEQNGVSNGRDERSISVLETSTK